MGSAPEHCRSDTQMADGVRSLGIASMASISVTDGVL